MKIEAGIVLVNKEQLGMNMRKDIYNFNTKMTKEEHEMLRELKDNYAVNIAQAFKLFLREYYERMKKFNGADTGK